MLLIDDKTNNGLLTLFFAVFHPKTFYENTQRQIHQVLSSDKAQRINAPVAQLHFRTKDDKVRVVELEKAELEKVIAKLEEAKEALSRLNYAREGASPVTK